MPESLARPDVEAFLRYLNSVPGPKVHQMSAPDARAMTRAMGGVADLPTGPIAVMRDLSAPGPGGPIGLRLFDARADRGPGPVFVFFHGGGWTIGDLDTYESACAEIARALDLPVVSVDYRLAPEHPWPAGPDDCEAAARWIASAPEELGLHPTALVLGGDSAGGTYAITTAMALRDTPAALSVIAQWALYPAADLATHYPSYKEFAEGHLLTRDAIVWFVANYAPDVTHWRGSPLQGAIAGLPPALVTTAGLDPIRDQGRAYAAALANAGVPVTFQEAKGMVHGFLTLRRAIPSAITDLASALTALKTIIAQAEAHL